MATSEPGERERRRKKKKKQERWNQMKGFNDQQGIKILVDFE